MKIKKARNSRSKFRKNKRKFTRKTKHQRGGDPASDIFQGIADVKELIRITFTNLGNIVNTMSDVNIENIQELIPSIRESIIPHGNLVYRDSVPYNVISSNQMQEFEKIAYCLRELGRITNCMINVLNNILINGCNDPNPDNFRNIYKNYHNVDVTKIGYYDIETLCVKLGMYFYSESGIEQLKNLGMNVQEIENSLKYIIKIFDNISKLAKINIKPENLQIIEYF